MIPLVFLIFLRVCEGVLVAINIERCDLVNVRNDYVEDPGPVSSSGNKMHDYKTRPCFFLPH